VLIVTLTPFDHPVRATASRATLVKWSLTQPCSGWESSRFVPFPTEAGFYRSIAVLAAPCGVDVCVVRDPSAAARMSLITFSCSS
jgi:hypothetical protein